MPVRQFPTRSRRCCGKNRIGVKSPRARSGCCVPACKKIPRNACVTSATWIFYYRMGRTRRCAAELVSGSTPRWLWGTTAAACLVAVGLAVIHFREKPPAPPEVMRFQIRLPDKVVFTRSAHPSLSPDGRHIAFPAVGSDGHNGIWVQDLTPRKPASFRHGSNPGHAALSLVAGQPLHRV